MRFAKLTAILSTTVLACGLIGCSGDDATNPEDAGDEGTLDASVDSPVDAPKDTGKDTTVVDAPADVAKDTSTDAPTEASDGSTDGATDASDAGDGGLPPPGSPCNTPNAQQQQDCGLCGFQKRACLTDGDGGYAWGSWGFCQGQVVNGCDPNLSYPDTACGNCGTKKTVCLNNCNFDQSQACTEPPNACAPGSMEFISGLSCDGGGRERTCTNQCTWGVFGSCQQTQTIPNGFPILQASATVGATVSSTNYTLPASPQIARPSIAQSCPFSSYSGNTSYQYALVVNSTNYTLKVNVYHSKSGSSPVLDTEMIAYAGGPPSDSDQNARKQCIVGTTTADSCSFSVGNPTPCLSSWAGIPNITLAPGTYVSIYSAAYYGTDSGPFQLNVYTTAAQ